MPTGNVSNNSSNQPIRELNTPQQLSDMEKPETPAIGSAFSRKVSIPNKEALEKIAGQQVKGQRAPTQKSIFNRAAQSIKNFKLSNLVDGLKKLLHRNTGSYSPEKTAKPVSPQVALSRDIASEAAQKRTAKTPAQKPSVPPKPEFLKKPDADVHPNKLHDATPSTVDSEPIYEEIPAVRTEKTASAITDEEQINSDLEMLNNLRKGLRKKNKGSKARSTIVSVLKRHDQLKKDGASSADQREFLRAQYDAITSKFGKAISKARVLVALPIHERVPQKVTGKKFTPSAPPVPPLRSASLKKARTEEPVYDKLVHSETKKTTTGKDFTPDPNYSQLSLTPSGDDPVYTDPDVRPQSTSLKDRQATPFTPEESYYKQPRSLSGAAENVYSTPRNTPLNTQNNADSDVSQAQLNLDADLYALTQFEYALSDDKSSKAWKAVVSVLENEQKLRQSGKVSNEQRAKTVANGLNQVLKKHQDTIEKFGVPVEELLAESDEIRYPNGIGWSSEDSE